jgi:opacity protein-like surface antigen
LPGGTPGTTVGTLFPSNFGGSSGGGAGGAQLGYNAEIGNFLIGLEADIAGVTDHSGGAYALSGSYVSSSTTESLFSSEVTSTVTFLTSSIVTVTFTNQTSSFLTSTITSFVTGGTNTSTITTVAPFGVMGAGRASVDWVSTFRTRFGVVADRALLYVTGGLAIGGVKQTTWTTLNIGGSSPSSYTWSATHSSTRFGGTIGAGIEYALTDHLSIRGQYLYFDLGRSTYGIMQTSGAATGIFGTSHTSELNGSIASLGFNWRFGSQ